MAGASRSTRAESVAQLPTFRNAYAKRRCIVPVDCFFEWRATKGARWPILHWAGSERSRRPPWLPKNQLKKSGFPVGLIAPHMGSMNNGTR
jgi:putative SOS response-associated peptidase YedK